MPSLIIDRVFKRFWNLIEKRAPRNTQHQLTHKNLYIFPTARGCLFLLLIVILWLIGTNYQNNLVLGMAFFLISIFVVSIFHTFSNMANLVLTYKQCEEAFAEEDANFLFRLNPVARRWVHAIQLSWRMDKREANVNESVASTVFIDVEQDHESVFVPLYVKQRGLHSPPRLRIESVYPFGLIRCWSWLSWDVSTIVYPKAEQFTAVPALSSDEYGDGAHPVKGGEDYSSLREYIAGDTIKHIAWKVYAKEKGLYIKEFNQNVSTEYWLDLNKLQHLGLEEGLSDMCFWALRLYQENEVFGLKLGSERISPDRGERHLKRVLKALACY